MSFPEEPLNLSVTEGGGYFPATIHQKLKGGRFEIVRKLGYGPRSSTWLVLDIHRGGNFAAKIFTVAASEQARRRELRVLKAVCTNNFCLEALPVFRESFWETSGQGDHLCVVMDPLSTSVMDLVKKSDKQRLLVNVVRRIVVTLTSALEELHDFNIMHGAVKADNIFFPAATDTDSIKAILNSEPAPTTVKVKKYTTVRSQPLVPNFKLYRKSTVADWRYVLSNFGHAHWQHSLEPEKNVDYLSAPETLLQDASCSIQTDIWMLGVTTFYLLTGSFPFFPKGKPSKQIATLSAILEDEFPKEWLNDRKMRDYKPTAHGYVTTIDVGLADSLPEADVAPAAAFIKACLRLDPKQRLTVQEAHSHEWLEGVYTCFGFCQ